MEVLVAHFYFMPSLPSCDCGPMNLVGKKSCGYAYCIDTPKYTNECHKYLVINMYWQT